MDHSTELTAEDVEDMKYHDLQKHCKALGIFAKGCGALLAVNILLMSNLTSCSRRKWPITA